MAAILLVSVPLGATVQDAGRSGWLHAGVPPSGALARAGHAGANLAVGNDARAAAIEIPLGPFEARASEGITVSVDGEAAVDVPDGGELFVPACERAVRYLAARGGFAVPTVLGARDTLAVAGFGGLEGRPLRAGDTLAVDAARPGGRGPAALPTLVHPADPSI